MEINFLTETLGNNLMYLVIFICIVGILVILGAGIFILGFIFKIISELITNTMFSPNINNIYKKNISSYKKPLIITLVLVLSDLALSVFSKGFLLKDLEFILSLVVAITVGWLTSRLFNSLLNNYLKENALSRKINGEILIVINIISDVCIFLIIFFIFAQTHNINVIGIVTSLGIGGLAVAFAAQQILQQLLGGIVLYIDRPFVVDDYIGLADGTFGKVETIGLRSTKIRNSGKGTLTIIPNNSLTNMSIENFSVARKIISLVYLTFCEALVEDKKALISKVILDSTTDIFGIDSPNTDVVFKEIIQDEDNHITQAQINFFILGSGEMSMDLRRQLLEIAKQNISLQLREYNIAFTLEEKPVDVDAPITI